MACELYCCLLPQCEALRICRSGFPIATLPCAWKSLISVACLIFPFLLWPTLLTCGSRASVTMLWVSEIKQKVLIYQQTIIGQEFRRGQNFRLIPAIIQIRESDSCSDFGVKRNF